MSLPRPPISLNTPIPNEPFSSEEVYYLEGNQGHLPLGAGLYIDPATGEFTDVEPSPYIYCTPQYGNLPPTEPPYGCNTEVNTAGVTDFTEAWENCENFTNFSCVDSSAVTDFTNTWYNCSSLTIFPLLNTSSGQTFTYAFSYTGVTTFPKLNLSNGVDFQGAWAGNYYMISFPEVDLSKGENFECSWQFCTDLQTFPPLDLSSGLNFYFTWNGCESLTSFSGIDVSSGTDFTYAWHNCSSLTSFPAGIFDSCSATNFSGAWQYCALNQTSVDNILVSLDTAGQSNGIVNIDGGTSAAPSATGIAAKASLQAKGWTVLTN